MILYLYTCFRVSPWYIFIVHSLILLRYCSCITPVPRFSFNFSLACSAMIAQFTYFAVWLSSIKWSFWSLPFPYVAFCPYNSIRGPEICSAMCLYECDMDNILHTSCPEFFLYYMYIGKPLHYVLHTPCPEIWHGQLHIYFSGLKENLCSCSHLKSLYFLW